MDHKIEINGEVKYKCDCGKIFDKKSSLNSHAAKCDKYIKEKNTYSKYKNSEGIYICECGKQYTNYQSFNGHLGHCRIHRSVLGKDCSEEFFHKRDMKIWGSNLLPEEKRKECYKKASETIKNKIKSGEIIPIWKGKHLPEEMKNKIRASHYKYLSDGKQHGAFIKNKPSYIEQWFIDNIINKLELYNKFDIVREFAFYPYFMDFAFVNVQLDVELDGEFHYIRESNIEHDKKRNEYILSKNWKIYRIRYNDIIKEPNKVINNFISYLNNINIIEKKLDNKLYSYKDYKINLIG